MADTTPAPANPTARKATLATMLTHPRGLWRFLRDPAAPWASKLLALFTIAYVVSPVDAIPDWLVPLLGWADDLGLTAAALAFIASRAARYANEHPGIDVRPASETSEAPAGRAPAR